MHRISNSKVKWAHPLKTWLTSSSVTGMSQVNDTGKMEVTLQAY